MLFPPSDADRRYDPTDPVDHEYPWSVPVDRPGPESPPHPRSRGAYEDPTTGYGNPEIPGPSC